MALLPSLAIFDWTAVKTRQENNKEPSVSLKKGAVHQGSGKLLLQAVLVMHSDPISCASVRTKTSHLHKNLLGMKTVCMSRTPQEFLKKSTDKSKNLEENIYGYDSPKWFYWDFDGRNRSSLSILHKYSLDINFFRSSIWFTNKSSLETLIIEITKIWIELS